MEGVKSIRETLSLGRGGLTGGEDSQLRTYWFAARGRSEEEDLAIAVYAPSQVGDQPLDPRFFQVSVVLERGPPEEFERDEYFFDVGARCTWHRYSKVKGGKLETGPEDRNIMELRYNGHLIAEMLAGIPIEEGTPNRRVIDALRENKL